MDKEKSEQGPSAAGILKNFYDKFGWQIDEASGLQHHHTYFQDMDETATKYRYDHELRYRPAREVPAIEPRIDSIVAELLGETGNPDSVTVVFPRVGDKHAHGIHRLSSHRQECSLDLPSGPTLCSGVRSEGMLRIVADYQYNNQS